MIIALAIVPVIASLGISLRKYLRGRRGRTIKLEIDGSSLELNSVNAKDAERIVADFISRHSRTAQKEEQ